MNFLKLILISLTLIFILGCSKEKGKFKNGFELINFLKKIDDLKSTEITFKVLEKENKSIPHAILEFHWEDNSILGFKTNKNGELTFCFKKNMLEEKINVYVRNEENSFIQIFY